MTKSYGLNWAIKPVFKRESNRPFECLWGRRQFPESDIYMTLELVTQRSLCLTFFTFMKDFEVKKVFSCKWSHWILIISLRCWQNRNWNSCFIIQMGNRLRKVKWLAQVCSVGKWWVWSFKVDLFSVQELFQDTVMRVFFKARWLPSVWVCLDGVSPKASLKVFCWWGWRFKGDQKSLIICSSPSTVPTT